MDTLHVRHVPLSAMDPRKGHRGLLAWRAVRALPLRLTARRVELTLGTVVLLVVALVSIAVSPAWSWSADWGYGPSACLGLLVAGAVALWSMGKI
jgi:hypothetical protein